MQNPPCAGSTGAAAVVLVRAVRRQLTVVAVMFRSNQSDATAAGSSVDSSSAADGAGAVGMLNLEPHHDHAKLSEY